MIHGTGLLIAGQRNLYFAYQFITGFKVIARVSKLNAAITLLDMFISGAA